MHLLNTKAVTAILLLALLLGVMYVYISKHHRVLFSEQEEITAGGSLQYKQPSITQGRTDVVTVTPWLAPVVWEGTFNPTLLDSIYRPQNISIAATVFAVGKYIRFLRKFLETAEQHFFVGFNVHVYVLTDRPDEVPKVKMAAGRQLTVQSVPSSNRWQEISARRMELIQKLIEEKLQDHVDYVFCLDVDSEFHGRWGTESLGGLVAVIHPGEQSTIVLQSEAECVPHPSVDGPLSKSPGSGSHDRKQSKSFNTAE